MNCNYKVKITDIQTKYKFKVFCTGYDDSEIKEKIDTMYEAWPKATAEGETPTLDNTANATMSIDLNGNTSQETTTGKNKYEGSQDFSGTWNNSYAWETDTNTYNGLVIKKKKSAWTGISKDIEVTSGKTYTFSVYIKADAARQAAIYLSGGTSGINNQKNIDITTSWDRYNLTFTASASGTIRARVENTSASDTNYTYICGYQLEESASMTDYEPYTNGASPNPDYPQDVHVVSGDNIITIENSDSSESQSYHITLPEGTELCKIGDYQDYIYKEGKKWYKYGAIGKVVLNGSETFNYSSYVSPYYRISTLINSKTNVSVNNQYGKLVANYFRAGKWDSGTSQGESVNELNGDRRLYFIINQDKLEDTSTNEKAVQSFTTWLSTHNTIVYYVLATPTTTEITDATLKAQLNALANAESYSGQTNISQTNDDKPFIITAKALKDLSNL